MIVEPLFDNILVRVEERAEKTEGGIYLAPESSRNEDEEPEKGTVIAIGPGRPEEKDGLKRKFVPMILKVGDVIIFSRYAGADVLIDGDKLLLMSEQTVLGVVKDI